MQFLPEANGWILFTAVPLLEKENVDTLKACPTFNVLGIPVEFLIDSMERYNRLLIDGVTELDK